MFNHYAKYYEIFNQDKPYKKEINFVYKWAGKPKLVFDIGCGPAHYWKHYPKTVHLLGVEKSPQMIRDNLRFAKKVICADITEYKHEGRFDCATALFNVINYIPVQNWWPNLPLEKDGVFIFDILDSEKAKLEGFRRTVRRVDGLTRIITPMEYDGKSVALKLEILENEDLLFTEMHTLYLYGSDMIEKFCQDQFEIVDIKTTESWNTWYKLKRK